MWQRSAPTNPELRPEDVHVWRIRTENPSLRSLPFERLLSQNELERANRYKRQEDRQDFILNRGLLRCLLSRYLRIPPIQVMIRDGRNGKPRLGCGGASPHFNLSHTRGLTLIALARDLELGVDVEWLDPGIDEMRLAIWLQFPGGEPLSPGLPRSERLRTVLGTWVRREAAGKAMGACLGDMLNEPSELDEWKIIDIDAGLEYAAALAVKAASAISLWEWAETDLSLLDFSLD